MGLIQREELRWYPSKPDCTDNWGFITVDMDVIKPAVVFLIIGYALAFLVAIGEHIINLYSRALFLDQLHHSITALLRVKA